MKKTLTKEERKTLELVIPELEKLGKPASVPLDVYFGVCQHIQDVCGIELPDCVNYYAISRAWSKHSGSESYPVPHPTLRLAGFAFNTTQNLWIDEYGENRREYARYLAQEFTKLLK